jgi:hypothetical protein
MNGRAFLVFRMLMEFAIGFVSVTVAIGVRVASRIWLDIVCRLLLAIVAIIRDANQVRKDSSAY